MHAYERIVYFGRCRAVCDIYGPIDRMDNDTYRTWEKHKPTLVKGNTPAIEQNNGKHANTKAWTSIFQPGLNWENS